MKEYLNILMSNIIKIVCITLIVFILTTSFLFIVNKKNSTIESKFKYNLNLNDKSQFIDSSFFVYQNILSEKNLEYICLSNDDFKSIDYKLLSRDPITTFKYNKKDDTFMMKLPLEYFKDEKEGYRFIDAINTKVLNDATAINNKMLLPNVIDDIISSNSYEEALSLLNYQNDILSTSLEILKLDGKMSDSTFESLYYEFNNMTSSDLNFRYLETVINSQGYCKDIETSRIQANRDIAILQYEINLNTKLIKSLEDEFYSIYGENGTSYVDNPLILEITKISKQNILLQYQLNQKSLILSEIMSIDNINFNDDFINLMNSYSIFINSYNNFYMEYLNSQIKCTYELNNNYRVVNKYSYIKVIPLITILTFIVTSTIIIVDDKKIISTN